MELILLTRYIFLAQYNTIQLLFEQLRKLKRKSPFLIYDYSSVVPLHQPTF